MAPTGSQTLQELSSFLQANAAILTVLGSLLTGFVALLAGINQWRWSKEQVEALKQKADAIKEQGGILDKTVAEYKAQLDGANNANARLKTEYEVLLNQVKEIRDYYKGLSLDSMQKEVKALVERVKSYEQELNQVKEENASFKLAIREPGDIDRLYKRVFDLERENTDLRQRAGLATRELAQPTE